MFQIDYKTFYTKKSLSLKKKTLWPRKKSNHLSHFFFQSIDQRNEAFFQDWPPRPVEQNEISTPRDPRLFPVTRTPQVPRKSLNGGGNYSGEPEFQNGHHLERSSSIKQNKRIATPNNQLIGKYLICNANYFLLNKSFHISDPTDIHKRDESMKRLNEWKQRMLQSPLTRKSSRAQTPVSPKLVNSKVSRKGSNASRTSRTRSLSRLSNRLSSTSSSDEGKRY